MSLFNESNIEIDYPVHFKCTNSIERFEKNGDFIRISDTENQFDMSAEGYIDKSKFDFNFIVFGNNKEEEEYREIFLKQKLKIAERISEKQFLSEMNKVISKYQEHIKNINYEQKEHSWDSRDANNLNGDGKDPF